MSPFTDDTRAVRPGEELDTTRLGSYLRRVLGDMEGPIIVEQFPAGHSNLTYLVKGRDRELVLRRPPFGSRVKTAHDMGREYRVLSKLCMVYPLAPRPLGYCADASVIGAPFYVMERMRGVILRKNLPEGLLIKAEAARRLSESFIDNLAVLHGLDYRSAGLGDLGKPQGYVQRQVEGWTRRYRDAQTDTIGFMDEIAGWLAAHQPPERGAALIHNDYKFDNIVLHPENITQIIGVLDWEMSTVGDPLMDLGSTLSYWVEATDSPELQSLRFGPTTLEGGMTRQELANRYGERTGRDISNLIFYYAFGLFKLAVIVQQIYYRYAQGLTRDERFANFILAVHVLTQRAAQAVETGKV